MLQYNYPMIRWSIRRDIPSILRIEEECHYTQLTCDNPVSMWKEHDFIERAKCRDMILLVYEIDDEILGHMVYQLYKHTVHIHRLMVIPNKQRCSIGTSFINHLHVKINGGIRRRELSVTVREHNVAAQLFFKFNGFTAKNVIRCYFSNPNEDGYAMRHCSNIVDNQRQISAPSCVTE